MRHKRLFSVCLDKGARVCSREQTTPRHRSHTQPCGEHGSGNPFIWFDVDLIDASLDMQMDGKWLCRERIEQNSWFDNNNDMYVNVGNTLVYYIHAAPQSAGVRAPTSEFRLPHFYSVGWIRKEKNIMVICRAMGDRKRVATQKV